ncbi:hypothetical protein RHSIM_Rhsim07G0196300 [Rhododendron simsii]|uniref:S-locus receptor kinase C-terminal domain-containing protein n=1 Tax=Rhododendron simsii TaxID=118357 RepID=A0A834GRP4_RHOSS|nr:hypothetical protein RHSIM_Rhsim07G0196300 [Rhododendron simsii]
MAMCKAAMARNQPIVEVPVNVNVNSGQNNGYANRAIEAPFLQVYNNPTFEPRPSPTRPTDFYQPVPNTSGSNGVGSQYGNDQNETIPIGFKVLPGFGVSKTRPLNPIDNVKPLGYPDGFCHALSYCDGKGRTTLQLLDERGTDADLPLFDLITIVAATDNFLLSNKLGQGGFGPVYKAWDLWREGKALDIVLPFLRDQDSFPGPQVLRYIHIGLLCGQEFATDQPTMSKVAFMLCNETALLSPKQRAFIMNDVRKDPDSSSTSSGAVSSVNDVTLTAIDGR